MNELFKVVVAGSRSFKDYTLLKESLDELLAQKGPNIAIISGTAYGADTLGEHYAEERNFILIRVPADWEQYGKRAGYLRNQHMAQLADAVVVFWDGESKGSKHMIDIATEMELPLRVIHY
ncbi:MAG TPA: DUF2493 domain-containing protein [Chitinophagaceae bacterium]